MTWSIKKFIRHSIFSAEFKCFFTAIFELCWMVFRTFLTVSWHTVFYMENNRLPIRYQLCQTFSEVIVTLFEYFWLVGSIKLCWSASWVLQLEANLCLSAVNYIINCSLVSHFIQFYRLYSFVVVKINQLTHAKKSFSMLSLKKFRYLVPLGCLICLNDLCLHFEKINWQQNIWVCF